MNNFSSARIVFIFSCLFIFIDVWLIYKVVNSYCTAKEFCYHIFFFMMVSHRILFYLEDSCFIVLGYFLLFNSVNQV